jgi:hypothetical protein
MKQNIFETDRVNIVTGASDIHGVITAYWVIINNTYRIKIITCMIIKMCRFINNVNKIILLSLIFVEILAIKYMFKSPKHIILQFSSRALFSIKSKYISIIDNDPIHIDRELSDHDGTYVTIGCKRKIWDYKRAAYLFIFYNKT